MSIKSLQSFEKILKDGSKTSDAKKLLLLIAVRSDTLDGLLLRSHLKASTIAGRTSDLAQMGYIKFVALPTGGQSWCVYVDDEAERDKLRKEYQRKKFEKWHKLGERMGWLPKVDNN